MYEMYDLIGMLYECELLSTCCNTCKYFDICTSAFYSDFHPVYNPTYTRNDLRNYLFTIHYAEGEI